MDVKRIGNSIRGLREEVAKLTQEELAEKAGVATRALQRIESGVGNPTISTIDKISKALGIRLDELITQKGEPVDVDFIKPEERIEQREMINEIVTQVLAGLKDNQISQIDSLSPVKQELFLLIKGMSDSAAGGWLKTIRAPDLGHNIKRRPPKGR